MTTCLSFLQTLIMGLAAMYIFPSSRSVGLHRANIAPAVEDGGGSVILTCKYEAGDPMLFSPWVIEKVPRDLNTSNSIDGIFLSQSLPSLHGIISDPMLPSDPVVSQKMPLSPIIAGRLNSLRLAEFQSFSGGTCQCTASPICSLYIPSTTVGLEHVSTGKFLKRPRHATRPVELICMIWQL